MIDRFHLLKALNEAVDEVRKEEWRALDTEGRKAIKGLRWLLAMRSGNRIKGNTRFLNSLRNGNRRIHRAWVLKDEFEQFWNCRYRGSTEKFLKRWMTAALRSRIPLLRTFVNTLRNHRDNVLTFIDRNLTNAVSEGLNRIIFRATCVHHERHHNPYETRKNSRIYAFMRWGNPGVVIFLSSLFIVN